MGRFALSASAVPARLAWGAALAACAAVLVAGCGRGSFVGRQYDDFTAYYNTYHNAEAAFEKGLASVTREEDAVDRARYISVFSTPQTGSGESAFEKAIQKSADLLRTHPNSKWVDDALMLIGRARYYRQNYVGAAQKFREVIAIGGERAQEARFRLARTLIAADRYTEAADALRAGLGPETEAGAWTARMWLARGELAVRQQRWPEAETALERGLRGELPETAGARASFLLGQVRETRGRYAKARVAYRQAEDYGPAYQLEFAARLAAIAMQGRAGAPGPALDRLGAVEREDNTRAMRGQIARVRAQLYRVQDQPAEARRVLLDALRSEEAPRGTVQGRLHYDLATLYRDAYEDFTNAAAHFDTAATTLSSQGERARTDARQPSALLPGAPSDAAAQADRFRDVADRSQAVARMDSLLRLGRMPPAEFRATIEQIRQRRLEAQEQEAERRREARFRRATQRRDGAMGGAAGTQARQNAVQTRQSDAGFLFYRDPTLVQQGRRQFRQTWGGRPLVDNWRRVQAIQGAEQAPAAANGAGGSAPRSEEANRARAVVDVSAVPRDSASRARMREEQRVAQYELAKALYRAAGRPDSAEVWFRRVLEADSDSSVAQRALYGLAQVHRAQGDLTAARAAYRRLVAQHPATPYGERARQQLGMEASPRASASPERRADSLYTRAYRAWRTGTPRAALNQFLSVAAAHPRTQAAPRALLAAGVVYHRVVRHDTTGERRRRFRQFVDSLAQSAQTADAVGDTSAAVSAPSRPPAASSPDSPAAQTAQSPPDTTARPSSRQPAPDSASPDPASPDAKASRRQADTTAVPSPPGPRVAQVDSSAGAARSPQASDSARADTVSARADTVRVSRPDTTRGAEATDATRQSGPGAQGSASLASPVETLFAHLAQQYAPSPVAKRAEALLGYLQRQQAAPDTAASDTARLGPPRRATEPPTRPPPDSAAPAPPQRQAAPPDSTARPPPDSLRPVRRRDSTAASEPDSIAAPQKTIPAGPSDRD